VNPVAAAVLLAALAVAADPGPAKGPTIRLVPGSAANPKAAFEVSGLDAANLRALAEARWTAERWAALFAVYVDDGSPGGRDGRPAVLGSYAVKDGVLRFGPRFPPAPGVRYRAVLDPSRLPRPSPARSAVVAEVAIPKPDTPATVVAHVYPSRDELPENLLKFYLHFSAPMSRGEAYAHVRLLDESGKAVRGAFLELGEELWDPDGKRFTLFLDPGRIKRGLKPREEFGPVLEAGKRYTLEIDRGWADAHGNPLKETYRKRFRAVAAAEQPPDPKAWRVEPPRAGGRAPLVVRFPGPLDHALLGRMLRVTYAGGREAAGAVTIDDEETRWRFTPARPWTAGAYRLVIDTALEDLAGNSIGRPFEVDVFHPVRRTVTTETVTLPVSIHE
jgi:hypothetical protein